MVRAVLQDGLICPLGPLPHDWHDGQVLVVDVEPGESPEEISAWAREMDEAARAIPEEDHALLLAALAEQKRESKDEVRRQMLSL